MVLRPWESRSPPVFPEGDVYVDVPLFLLNMEEYRK
jgi:hypothetical protein